MGSSLPTSVPDYTPGVEDEKKSAVASQHK